jgi:hypothetical protein
MQPDCDRELVPRWNRLVDVSSAVLSRRARIAASLHEPRHFQWNTVRARTKRIGHGHRGGATPNRELAALNRLPARAARARNEVPLVVEWDNHFVACTIHPLLVAATAPATHMQPGHTRRWVEARCPSIGMGGQTPCNAASPWRSPAEPETADSGSHPGGRRFESD